MSGVSSSPPTAQSTTNNLPTDLWLLIFEQEVLDYHDYKSLKRVCKSFYELEKAQPLPRQPPLSLHSILSSAQNRPIRPFHPIFQQLDLVCTSLDRAFGYYDKEDEKPDFSALLFMSEFATAPACRLITVAMGGEALAQNKNGVTVEDVLKACVEMWTSRPDEETCEEMVEIFAEWNPIKAEEVTWRDVLLDHCFYEGMRSAKVISKDWVELTPNHFGS